MSRHQRPGSVCLPPGFLAVSVFIAGILFAIIIHDARSRTIVRDVHPVALVPASTSARAPHPDSGLRGVSAVRIDVDATRTGPTDEAVVHRLIDALGSFTREADGRGSAGPDDRLSACLNWTRIAAPAAPVLVDSLSPANSLDTYAVGSRDGATTFVWNRGPLDLQVSLRVRLRQAPYKIERLTVGRASNPERLAVLRAADGNVSGGSGPADFHLVRLKGRDLAVTGTVNVPLIVRSGEIAMVRFTDTALASRLALNEVRTQLRRLPAASGDLAGRLRVIFDGTGSCESAISQDCRLSADRRRTDIHRFLLVLGQAHSLQRNYPAARSGRTVNVSAFQAALERLNDSLADVSATLLGLVPGITVSSEPPTAQPVIVSGLKDDPSDAGVLHTIYATITLSNQGSRSAELVKIGMDKGTLDAGIHCEPADPALFGALGPGETARAVYRLQWKGNLAPQGCCAGDISYFTAGAPAHLRPGTW